jgi:hypothetical protein
MMETPCCRPEWTDKDSSRNKVIFARVPHTLNEVLSPNYFRRLCNGVEVGDMLVVSCGATIGTAPGSGGRSQVVALRPLEFALVMVANVGQDLVEITPMAAGHRAIEADAA